METSVDRSIPLTPAQAIKIHGWLRPIRRLYWNGHVVARKDLTFSMLVEKMGLCDETLASLFQLQPDARQWMELKKITLEDCEVMYKFWNVHPMRDFYMEDAYGVHEVQVGEILQAGLSFECLKGCKVTLEELAKAGLNPDNMRLFHFSLYQWKLLGFEKKHADCMLPLQIENVFGMTQQVLEASFVNDD